MIKVNVTNPQGRVYQLDAVIEGNYFIVKTRKFAMKFNKKKLSGLGDFKGWTVALAEQESQQTTKPQQALKPQHDGDLFKVYQHAVALFEEANREYMQAEAEWLRSGIWPDDKRDTGKKREDALRAKIIASDNYYNTK